jgi:hypothetical protein
MQGGALALRGVWCLTKFGPNVHLMVATHPTSAADYMARGVTSRLAECLQYGSCLIVVWQWALPCALILNWPSAKLQRLKGALVSIGTCFSFYTLVSTPFSYASRKADYQTPFDAIDSIVFACAFSASACGLLVFSLTVTRSISQWCSINSIGVDARDTTSIEDRLIITSLRYHLVRIKAAAGTLVAAYLLRASVWSCSTFGYFGPVPV